MEPIYGIPAQRFVDAYEGRGLCEEGRKRGVKTPFNDAVVGVVRGLGVGFKPDPKHLEPVIALLPRGL